MTIIGVEQHIIFLFESGIEIALQINLQVPF